MKVLKIRERNVWYLDWNYTYHLNPVYARRFVNNGWTHVLFKGKLFAKGQPIYFPPV